MDQIIKSYLGMFFVVLLLAVGYGVMFASIKERGATSFMNRSKNVLAHSAISPSSISELKNEASELGFELDVDVTKDSSGRPISAKVSVSYDYGNVMFLSNETQVIYDYVVGVW